MGGKDPFEIEAVSQLDDHHQPPAEQVDVHAPHAACFRLSITSGHTRR
jgi:hypothetical protein